MAMHIVPTIAEGYANVLEAQARFSTAEQLFLSSSDPKKRACCISNFFYILKLKHKISQKYGGGRHIEGTNTAGKTGNSAISL